MKKFLGTLILGFLLSTSAFAKIGKGELKLDSWAVDYFIKYIKGKGSNSPELFIISQDSSWATYYYCPAGQGNCRDLSDQKGIKICERESNVDCATFARGRTIKWKNGINKGRGKTSRIKSKWSDTEIIAKLTELGFIGDNTSSTESITPKITEKVEKKETQKVVKKYELQGERSIALSWDGYEDLIAGTVEFDEANYKGTLNVPLPNNDGTCDGSYSLQEGGKGTWQIACTNNMGAAGTLKWSETGGVTGKGRDHNDKKVIFTVSKKS